MNGRKTLQSCTVSTPGRVCLFGEHQDYLGLPVIPCAISLRISISAERRNDRMIRFDLPDVGQKELFSLDGELPYEKGRDYLRSVVNVMQRKGYTFSSGFSCVVRGNIPINSGTSSSSALIVTWVNVLARLSDQAVDLPHEEIAALAHSAEVLEFGEPGGMMDHYSTSLGGILFLRFHPNISFDQIHPVLGTFVLGDSCESKETTTILARVKDRVLSVASRLRKYHSDFSLHTVSEEGTQQFRSELNEEESTLLRGTIRNRNLTLEALEVLSSSDIDHRKIGSLLNEHQSVLRDVLRISTPKIDRMLDSALKAGALGGKINGSGGGGCMFAYAPDHAEEVAEAICREGGKAFIVRTADGTRVDAVEVVR
jgi:galactokinase